MYRFIAAGRLPITRSLAQKTASLFLLAILSTAIGETAAQTVLEQIRGIAFTADGKGIMVSGTAGIVVHRARRWKDLADAPRPIGAVAVTRNAIYAAASPAGGLLASADAGVTWRSILDSGEADFSHLAAGLNSDAIYVTSTAAGPQMPIPGLHHTQDGAKTWQRAAAQGLTGSITGVAVHPVDPQTIVVGTSDGLHVSRDAGATFTLVPAGKAVTAVFFDAGGEHVYVAREGVSALHRVSLEGERPRALPVPIASRDSIVHIAQNPARPHELVVATRLRSVFVSTNGGGTWRTIAREGRPA